MLQANMSQQEPVQDIPLVWFTNIKAFFQLPNPKIFHLFIISSTVTFSLGVAMAVEWFLRGQYHIGYEWMAYCAPSIIALPIILWLTCLSSAIVFGVSKQEVNHASPSDDQNTQQVGEIQPEQALELQDQQTVVEIQALRHHPSESIKQTVCSSLKRSMSVPMAYTRYDFSKINRSSSFR